MDPEVLKFGLTAFAAIFAVLNPFSILPIFLAINQNTRPGVRRNMALVISIFVVIALLLCLLAGEIVLDFFGISIPAFQIAGGVLLFSTGLSMINGTARFIDRFVAEDSSISDFKEANARFRDLLVPIGTPLFVGPGSISTVILFGNQAKVSATPALSYTMVASACLVCAIATLLIFLSADALVKVLRTTGIAILSRLMGLLLCAIAVQFSLSALQTLMPSLFRAA
ncbi:MAG: MarC family protein [Fimbriimonadaceae bacterium]|nr:MAG: MarC family protein [Fimbriimonadaceae bacterium]